MLKIGGQKIPMTTKVLVVGDASLIALGLCLAILIRLHDFRSALHYLRQPDMPFRFGVVLVPRGISLYYNDVYASRVLHRRRELFVSLFQAIGTAWFILAILFYLTEHHSLGRGFGVMS